MHHRFSSAFVVIAAAVVWAGNPAAAEPPLPAALANLTSFHGHLSYRAHPMNDPAFIVTGSLIAQNSGWTLDETSTCCQLHLSNRDSWIREGSHTLSFDDPFQLNALTNSWAVVLATSLGTRMSRDPAGSSWTASSGVRFYMDLNQSQILGVSDLRSDSAFAFSRWLDIDGLQLPQSIVRLRGGVPDGSFVIDDYEDVWTSAPAAVNHVAAAPAAPATLALSVAVPDALPRGIGLLRIIVLLVVAAVCLVAWIRRDAFIDRVTRRLATDPRAWRHAGVSLFVSPEGILTFERRSYRVGSVFFNRAVVVQTSPLFLKVSAPGESRTLILARKFPVLSPAQRRATAGFTLLESLTASALFAAVIVVAVFPTLIVLAHADRIAAQHQAALQIASNALTDEETSLAYGYGIADESVVSPVGDLTLRETVTPAGVSGLHNLTIDVSDRGRSLARIVTLLGPPVPPPSAGDPSPPPGER